jgi:carbamoyltransferase
MSAAVLGLGGSSHDFSAAIVADGTVLVAIEDERIQRVKRGRAEWHSQPARDAAAYCLEQAGIKLEDLDGIYCSVGLEQPTEWLDWSRVTFVNHHTAHAAASFFTTPHEQSTLLVVDGHGGPVGESENGWELETISTGWADGTQMTVEPHQTGIKKKTFGTWRYPTQNSIGWFYRVVTLAIGFGYAEQGKAMGLAAYGTPRYVDDLAQFVAIPTDGRFVFDPHGGIWDWLTEMLARPGNAVQVRADLAYAAQEILVQAVVGAALAAYRQAPSDVLSFGGGCALNTLANTRILQATPFEHLAVYPAAGDNGLSVGAALYGAHVLHGNPRPAASPGWRGRAVYVGREYLDEAIDAALAGAPVLASRPSDLEREVARAVVDGACVAVCRGRSEIGPRALGNRSLIALPGPSQMRDHVNLNIKGRESFRPLAPVVPLEHLDAYFDGPSESPYMLLVSEVREEPRERLAAVTHVDGTARVQTVRAEDNPFLHRLLGVVGELTGVPVLLNTSLNLPGKPIVETPSDALELFIERPIDALVLGDRLVRKYSPWVPPSRLAGWATRPATIPPRPPPAPL